MKSGPFISLDEDFKMHSFSLESSSLASDAGGANGSLMPCTQHCILTAWILGLEGKEGYEEAKVSGEHQSCYSGQIESQHHDVTLYFPVCLFFPLI